MLATQEYEGHLSIHDGETAASLGLAGAPIEGPTHFSQFVPLLHEQFGDAWFERGCISAHYQNMVVEGEQVRAFVEQSAQKNAMAPRFLPVLRQLVPTMATPKSASASRVFVLRRNW
jgi:hypothetical protein